MQTVNIDILNSHIIELDERLEGFALATATSFHEMQEQMNQRFAQADQRFDELKEMTYSNGDALARVIKKMDEEFSAATIQRIRIADRMERVEKAVGFV